MEFASGREPAEVDDMPALPFAAPAARSASKGAAMTDRTTDRPMKRRQWAKAVPTDDDEDYDDG